jgi:acid phosphatase type 7
VRHSIRHMPVIIPLLFAAGLVGCQAADPVSTIPTIQPSQAVVAETSMSPTQPAADLPTPTMTSTATLVPTATLTPEPTLTPTPASAILTGAGDIAVCGTKGSAETAALLANIPGDIFTAGDNSNEDGSLQQFTDCFGPTWGQFLARIHPVPGNHDYMTPGAADYYRYFGAAAGDPAKGYYSFEEGPWHVVMLNSNCNDVGCGAASEQIKWLKADLAEHPTKCTLAVWHHPRFSSGLSGSSGMYPFWQVLYEQGVDVVINGNDHDYERFAPQDPVGKADPEQGIREFIVGTGGASQRAFNDIVANSEVHQTGVFGVIKLTLSAEAYDWEFIPVEGGDFHDSGSAACH